MFLFRTHEEARALCERMPKPDLWRLWSCRDPLTRKIVWFVLVDFRRLWSSISYRSRSR